MLLKSGGRVDAAERAQQHLALALFDRAARNLDVLGHDRVAHLRHRQAVRVQLLDVDDDVNLARPAAAEIDFADAVHRLDRPLHLLVGDLGERPEAHRIGRQHDRHHGIRIGIDLGDDRRQDLRRHVRHRGRHLLADVVRRVVDVALEDELDRDLRLAFLNPHRRHLVDAGNAAERLLHRLDDGGRHLVRARAGQQQRDVHRRRIGARKEVDAEGGERKDPEHHERHDEHRGEHRTTDAEF